MSNPKATSEYWDQRVRETKDLRTVVFNDVYFDKFDQCTRQLLSLFKDKRVLDVGCGYGRLCDIFINYAGMDFSREMIAKAKKMFPNKYFEEMDAHTYLAVFDKYDVVFECMCLSSLGMTPEQFRDTYAHLANIIICIEPHDFRIFYI